MKLKKIVDAYLATLELSRTDTDYKTAYALMKLKKKTQNQFEFYVQQERELLEKYADKDENGSVIYFDKANVRISDPERLREYEKARRELNELETDDKIRQYSAPVPKSIKPSILEALDGFILFEGVDEE